MFTDPLPSNGRPIARVCFRVNVFTEWCLAMDIHVTILNRSVRTVKFWKLEADIRTGEGGSCCHDSHSGGVESKLGPLSTSATEWPIVPDPGDYYDGEFGGMKIGWGNRSTRRKPAPPLLCLPQMPLDQTRV
jgi:hypothetical protein